METFVIGLIIVIGILAFFVILMAIAEPYQERCNSDCKKEIEKKGAMCHQEKPLSYLCKRPSKTSTAIVIPWGSATMPNERNFIPNPVTVSIGINNTVTWTNVDELPHRIVSDDVPFDSGAIRTNQSWAKIFEEPGVYNYQSNSYSWLSGQITVVPLDPNYQKGNPIALPVFPLKGIEYMIFRESDSWGHINNISILDEGTVRIEFVDYPEFEYEETVETDFHIGESFVGACFDTPHSQLYHFTLERIETKNTPYVEFRSDMEKIDDNCDFEKNFRKYLG